MWRREEEGRKREGEGGGRKREGEGGGRRMYGEEGGRGRGGERKKKEEGWRREKESGESLNLAACPGVIGCDASETVTCSNATDSQCPNCVVGLYVNKTLTADQCSRKFFIF
jgi:hypothetical protein